VRRLKPFSYFEPTTLKEAIEILVSNSGKAHPFAGGTDLLVRMKRGQLKPKSLINLKRIKGLDEIQRVHKKGMRIGALASIASLQNDPSIQSSHPIISQAAAILGTPSVRNLGTLGGNIGRASPASDMVPSLMVLQAMVTTESPGGERELAIDDIFSGPGATTLSSGEVIKSVFIPHMKRNSCAVYLKLGRTEGRDSALVGVAALLSLDSNGYEAEDARIALASVGPVPLRAMRAEEVLLSGSLTEERVNEASRAAAADSRPISDLRCSAAYRKEMVRVFTLRALERLLQQVREGKE